MFNGELLDKTDEGSIFWVDKNELSTLNLAEGMKERLPMFLDKNIRRDLVFGMNITLVN